MPETANDRLIVFERCGADFGVSCSLARRVVRLGKECGNYSGSHGTIRIDDETLVIADTAARKTDTGMKPSAPGFAVMLTGSHQGFALAADRLIGIRMVRKHTDASSGREGSLYVTVDGSRTVTVPDLDSLCALTTKTDAGSGLTGSLPTYGGKYLIFSAKGAFFAIPSEKVKTVLPAGLPDSGVTIDPAGLCVSLADRGHAAKTRFQRIVTVGGGESVTVMAERVIGLETIDAGSMEYASGHAEWIHPTCMAAIRTKGRRVFILDPSGSVSGSGDCP